MCYDASRRHQKKKVFLWHTTTITIKKLPKIDYFDKIAPKCNTAVLMNDIYTSISYIILPKILTDISMFNKQSKLPVNTNTDTFYPYKHYSSLDYIY